MKRINLFQFGLFFFLFISTSNLFAQSYMTLSNNPQVIGYTGAHLDLAIPTNPSPYNVLRFTLKGGDGGDRYVNYEVTSYRAKGGVGATATCEFRVGNGSALEPGGTLRFIVGEKGQGTNGVGTEGCGGGGGTGLLYLAPGLNATSEDDWVILAVAGGGGGAYANGVGGTKDGKGGNDDPDGSGSNGHNASSSGASDPHGTGGENGDGGLASDGGTSGGAGGGGYLGDGQVIGHASASNCTGTGGSKGGILGGDGGKDDSCVDGRDGGWGYGGGGSGEAAGGGGGGYSGGGGGTSGFGNSSGGGGGGSYVEQTLAESFGLTEGGTTSDPQNGVIIYQFDSEGPIISSCNDFLISLNASGQVTIDATTILDEYYAPDGSTITSTQSDFDCDDIGDNIVTVTITDSGNNTATCDAYIEIEKNTSPTAICTSATIQLNANGEGTISANAIDNGSSDICGIDSKSLSKTSFDCDDVGSNTVTLTVYDPIGYASTCSATVSVQDQVNPIAYCSDITIQLDQNGEATIDEDDIDNGSSDACGIDSRSLNVTSFDCDDVGFNAVALTVTDVNNNSDFCTASVVVEDQVLPTALCQDITVQLDANGEATITPDDIDNGSSDACGIDSKSLNVTSYDCDDVGSNIVLLIVRDESNNSNNCTASVVVEDQTLPTVLCQDITVQLDVNGEATIDEDDIDNGSSDACGIQSLAITQSDFDCSDVGNNPVTLTAHDPNGNSSTCLGTVMVEDNVAPIANCQDVTIQLDADGNGSTSADDVDNGSSDACGIAATVLNQNPNFDCEDVGGNNVSLTATDVYGNSSTCSATVTVQDQVIPVAICQNVTIQLDANGASSTTAEAIDNGSSDACGIDAKSLSHTSFDCDDLGDNAVDLTVTDVNGNSNYCTATVTVIDIIPPLAACQDLTVDFNGEQTIGWTVDQLWDESGSTDNCVEVFAVSQSLSQANCGQLGSILTVTVTIEDGSGNLATCDAYVTVDGLPCGWYADPDGINCPDTETDYDTTTDEFSLTSEGCYDPSYYRYTDDHGFIQTELCGDGEIIAQVTGVIGSGWAGISMRENADESAPMLQLMIDGSLMTRREVRMSAGGAAFAHQFQTQGNNWLKLTRSGNQFGAYQSQDGINWSAVFVTNLSMSDCIDVGLITMNGSSTGEVTGLFENVSVKFNGSNNVLATPGAVNIAPEENPTLDFSLFPNPATNTVNLQLDAFLDKEIHIQLYNHYGQAIIQQRLSSLQQGTLPLNLQGLPAGTYLVQVQADHQRLTKKLVVSPF